MVIAELEARESFARYVRGLFSKPAQTTHVTVVVENSKPDVLQCTCNVDGCVVHGTIQIVADGRPIFQTGVLTVTKTEGVPMPTTEDGRKPFRCDTFSPRLATS